MLGLVSHGRVAKRQKRLSKWRNQRPFPMCITYSNVLIFLLWYFFISYLAIFLHVFQTYVDLVVQLQNSLQGVIMAKIVSDLHFKEMIIYISSPPLWNNLTKFSSIRNSPHPSLNLQFLVFDFFKFFTSHAQVRGEGKRRTQQGADKASALQGPLFYSPWWWHQFYDMIKAWFDFYFIYDHQIHSDSTMTNASSLQGPAASTNGSLLQGLLDRISATMEYLKSQFNKNGSNRV